jgi:hypothetical protein
LERVEQARERDRQRAAIPAVTKTKERERYDTNTEKQEREREMQKRIFPWSEIDKQEREKFLEATWCMQRCATAPRGNVDCLLLGICTS